MFGGGFAVFLAWMLLARKRRRAVVRSFYCPYKECDVTCTLSESLLTGAMVDVTRCSAFSPPERVPCARRCVDELELDGDAVD